jgi:hypothetical protein
MLSYWYHGNKSSFVLLLSLVLHAAVCRDIVKNNTGDPDSIEMADDYLHSASEFHESFVDDVFAIWDMVTSPFSKGTKEEITDFLVDDDDEEVVEDAGNRMAHRALQMEAELEDLRNAQDKAKEYVARYENLDDDEESHEVGDESDDEEASENDVANGGYFYESSEPEDDWQESILNKRVARPKSLSPRKRSSRGGSLPDAKLPPAARSKENGLKNGVDSALTLSSDDEVVAPKSTRRRSIAIQDSDDEG